MKDFPVVVTIDAHGNSLHKDIEAESAKNLAESKVKIVFGTDIGTFSFATNNAGEFAEMVANGIAPARALKAALA